MEQLRMLTYLVPELPLGLYQTYQHYLEEALGVPASLMVESRWKGPTRDRPDPFKEDQVDIAFMCSAAYLRQVEKGNKHLSLLPAAPVHRHPRSDLRPVYFADVIVHKDRASQFKDFSALRGFRWGYADDISMSGKFQTMAELRKLGHDASFFSEWVKTGSHSASIAAVLSREVDATAVDANVLRHHHLLRPDQQNLLHVLDSWGPMPVQPVVVNANMPASTRERIVAALLAMGEHEAWRARLERYHVAGFAPTSHAAYQQEVSVREQVQNMDTNVVYY